MVSAVVDARGKACPLPILALARSMRDLALGGSVVLLATDPAAELDVRAWCEMTGNTLVSVEATGELVRATVRKGP